jgi:hypothetical protein
VALVILGVTAKQPASWEFFATLALNGVVLIVPIIIFWLRRRRKHSTTEAQP